MSEHRTHLVTLLQMIWRFLFLLIFPAARGFLTALSGGNVAEWLDGAWKDILIIAAILLLAFLQWWCLRYRWESVGLSIRRGVLFRQRMFIPAEKSSRIHFFQTGKRFERSGFCPAGISSQRAVCHLSCSDSQQFFCRCFVLCYLYLTNRFSIRPGICRPHHRHL